MKSNMRNLVLGLAAAALLLVPAVEAADSTNKGDLSNQVRRELVMLPWFGVFDNLAYRVDGNVVTLYGSVTRPVLRSDAEGVVKRIEGVERVQNNIEVLPLSPNDDRIRIATARAIYGYGPMQRYALGAQPPIRIIVKNGNVRLEGVVANEMDKNMAGIRANGVFGAFSVTNDLKVEGRG